MNILLLASSVAVLMTGLGIALALPLRGSLERTVAAILLAQADMTLILLGGGVVLHRLDGPVIAFLALFQLVVLGVIVRRRLGVLGATGRAWILDARAGLGEAIRNPAVLLLGSVGLIVLVWRLILALRLPPLDYDGMSYHLVTVDMWLQGNEISRVPQRIWSDSYPANGELLTLWLMAFTRNDGLATLTGLLPIPLAALATVSIARTLGARRDWALLVGLVLLATPALIVLAGTSYVDPLAVADLAAMWAFGLAAMRAGPGSRRSALLLLTGVGVGLAIGTKGSNIVPALALVGVMAFDAARRHRQGRRIEWFMDAARVGAPAVVLGGYWYVKNLIVFGNPLWPFTIGPLKGLGTFAQLIVQTPPSLVGLSPIRQILASWSGDLGARSYVFDTRIGGFGLSWPVIAILAVGGGLVLLRSRQFAPILAVFLPAVGTLAVMPMGWWPRYTLFVVVAGLTLAAITLTRLDRRLGLAVGVLIALLAVRSLGVASATANTPARASGSGPVSLVSLTSVIRADDETRAHLGLWAQCRGFDQLPDGAVVATDGFNLLHLVVGHDLMRRLTPPIAATADPALLLAEVRSLGGTHLAIRMSGPSAIAVRADPASFRSLGAVCRDVELVAVAGP